MLSFFFISLPTLLRFLSLSRAVVLFLNYVIELDCVCVCFNEALTDVRCKCPENQQESTYVIEKTKGHVLKVNECSEVLEAWPFDCEKRAVKVVFNDCENRPRRRRRRAHTKVRHYVTFREMAGFHLYDLVKIISLLSFA